MERLTETLWLRNTGDYYVLALTPCVGGVLGVTAAVLLLKPSPLYLVLGSLLGFSLALAALGASLLLKVGFTADTIVLRRPFTGRRIHRKEVSHVVLDPPVEDVARGHEWFGKTGRMWVYLKRDGKPVELHTLMVGLKLRVARVLDPKHFPGNPLEGLDLISSLGKTFEES